MSWVISCDLFSGSAVLFSAVSNQFSIQLWFLLSNFKFLLGSFQNLKKNKTMFLPYDFIPSLISNMFKHSLLRSLSYCFYYLKFWPMVLLFVVPAD